MHAPELLAGGLIADSLALAPHWIYNPEEIAEKFGKIARLEKPRAGSYHEAQPAGGQTHYGHQTIVLANVLDHGWSLESFRLSLRSFWENSSSYQDKATKAFLEGEEGSSSELGGASRSIAVLADMSDEEEAVRVAAEQTLLTHTEEVARSAEDLVRLAFRLRRGEPLGSAVTAQYAGQAALAKAEGVAGLEPNEALGQLGRDCSLGSALPSLLYLLMRGKTYKESLLENVMAGGDSAARGLLLGGLLAAAHGGTAIPEEWRAQHLWSSKR